MIEQSTLAITYWLEWEYTLLAINFATYKGKKLQQNIYFIVLIMFLLFFPLGLGVEFLLDKNCSIFDWWNGERIFNLKKYYVINTNINTMYIISRLRAWSPYYNANQYIDVPYFLSKDSRLPKSHTFFCLGSDDAAFWIIVIKKLWFDETV